MEIYQIGAGHSADTNLLYLGEMLVDYVRVYQCATLLFLKAYWL